MAEPVAYTVLPCMRRTGLETPLTVPTPAFCSEHCCCAKREVLPPVWTSLVLVTTRQADASDHLGQRLVPAQANELVAAKGRSLNGRYRFCERAANQRRGQFSAVESARSGPVRTSDPSAVIAPCSCGDPHNSTLISAVDGDRAVVPGCGMWRFRCRASHDDVFARWIPSAERIFAVFGEAQPRRGK
jgi:hypothetical protein